MSETPRADQPVLQTAEEVLRAIYGDDFKGCTVSLDDIAAIIQAGMSAEKAPTHELLDLYEKLVEAIHLLSTPPENKKLPEPDELRSLLSERMDAIHALTTKTIATTALVKKQR